MFPCLSLSTFETELAWTLQAAWTKDSCQAPSKAAVLAKFGSGDVPQEVSDRALSCKLLELAKKDELPEQTHWQSCVPDVERAIVQAVGPKHLGVGVAAGIVKGMYPAPHIHEHLATANCVHLHAQHEQPGAHCEQWHGNHKAH